MAAGRDPVYSPSARTIEHLLALKPYSLTGVERRRNGDFALTLHGQQVADRWTRVLRMPAKRVFGYQQRSPHVRDRDVRAQRKANSRRMALWVFDHVGYDCPLVERALWERDLTAVDELRAAILALCPPDYVVLVWRRTA